MGEKWEARGWYAVHMKVRDWWEAMRIRFRRLPSSVDSLKPKKQGSLLRQSRQREIRKLVFASLSALVAVVLVIKAVSYWRHRNDIPSPVVAKAKEKSKRESVVMNMAPTSAQAQTPKLPCRAVINRFSEASTLVYKGSLDIEGVEVGVSDSLRRARINWASRVYDECHAFVADTLKRDDPFFKIGIVAFDVALNAKVR